MDGFKMEELSQKRGDAWSGHPAAASEPTVRRVRKADSGSKPEGGRSRGRSEN